MDPEKTEMQVEAEDSSKKRKAESSLSDLKKQQLAEARHRKAQKAAERAQELLELKSRLDKTESKLNETESNLTQKITDIEVQKEVEKDVSEKKQKVVVADSEPVKKTQAWDFSNFEGPIRTGALVLFAVGSFYMKNMWKKQVAAPAPAARVERKQVQSSQDSTLHNLHKPLSSLFPRL